MIKINLLPVRAAQKKESIRQQISIMILILIVISAGIGYAHISMTNNISHVEERITKVNIEIEQLKKKTGEVDDFKKKKRELIEKLNIIDRLSKNKTGPVLVLDAISNIIPDKMWFSSIRQAGAGLEIDGVALDNETIAVFIASLKRSPRFKGINLIQTLQIDYESYKLTSFKLTCAVDLTSVQGQ